MPITEEVMLKTSLKMTVSKLEFKTSKMKQLNKIKLTEISKDLKSQTQSSTFATPTTTLDSRKFDRGMTLIKIKINKLINDDNQIDLFEILTVDLQLLLSKLPNLITIRHNPKTGAIESTSGMLDNTVVKLVRRLLYLNNYIPIKEYKKLCSLLVNKFGKVFYEHTLNDFGMTNDGSLDKDDLEVIKKCKNENMDELVELYLKEICSGYDIDLYGEKLEAEQSEGDDDKSDSDKDGGSGGVREAAIGTITSGKDEITVTKKIDELDDLKKRFNALKRM